MVRHSPLLATTTDAGRGDGHRSTAQCRRCVILAGGRGTRLAPYTSVLPKPLMPIGERSILELVIGQLSSFGISQITLAVGYLAHLIQAVLDHVDHPGVEVTYVREGEPLGTAAPLRLIGDLDDTFIAMNGDVLTDLDYGALIRQHKSAESALTIATKQRVVKIDYGVLDVAELAEYPHLTGFTEKPQIHYTVSMGVYVLEPEVLAYIPPVGPFDVPDLVRRLLDDDQRVGAYRHDGLWFDIGRPDDYIEANSMWLQRAAEMPGSPGHTDPAATVNGRTARNTGAPDELGRSTPPMTSAAASI
jgi:NDP-mannose synthase